MYFLHSFPKRIKVICPALLFVSLLFIGGWWGRVRASQDGTGATILLADQGPKGIKGYVVGSSGVAAYACPDTNTSRCPIRLVLAPGTQVLIVDNVVGGFVPALNDNSWRKIVYQGQTLFVPAGFISVVPVSSDSSDDLPAVSFAMSGEDQSTSAPSFSTAPVTKSQVALGGGLGPDPTTWTCALPGWVGAGGYDPAFGTGQCCPQGTTLKGPDCVGYNVTWYTPTDGRINGGAGDRIAVYCRRTGRIEVWSINNSQGHFLVSFSHAAVDAAGKAGFRITVGTQGIVTIIGDGRGSYLATIQGGPFNATGQGDFAKSFRCYTS